MARFFNGLNIEVQDRVEMVVYYNIQDLVHQVVLAEQQIKWRQVSTVPSNTLNTWRHSKHKSEDVVPSSRTTTSNRSHGSVQKDASKLGLSRVDSSAQSTTHTSDIECFKCGGRGHMKRECPNEKRVLLTKDGYASASDEEVVSDTSSEKSEDVEKVISSFEAAESYPSLMVQRVQEDRIEDKGQRWNIFQTQCKINNTNSPPLSSRALAGAASGAPPDCTHCSPLPPAAWRPRSSAPLLLWPRAACALGHHDHDRAQPPVAATLPSSPWPAALPSHFGPDALPSSPAAAPLPTTPRLAPHLRCRSATPSCCALPSPPSLAPTPRHRTARSPPAPARPARTPPRLPSLRLASPCRLAPATVADTGPCPAPFTAGRNALSGGLAPTPASDQTRQGP
nr:protein PRRC2C-like [Aegilops tauschii subsp. strangulata]